MIHIPETIDAATDALEGIGALLRAKEWERSAIVYAFTRNELGRGDKVVSTHDFRLPIKSFAAIGIKGLTTEESVRKYRMNWEWAIDNGYGSDVAPGDKSELPDVKWPGIDSRPNTHRVEKMSTKTLAEGIAQRDDVADVIEAVADEGKLSEVISGTGQSAAKTTRRQRKEEDAAANIDKPAAAKKQHTSRGSAEFLIRAHAARSEWQAVADYLESHTDLELTDEESELIKAVHDEMVALSASILLAITSDLVSELEKR